MSELERTPARAGDSGAVERLPDGSVSIPVFEERLVVRKRRVVRERIVIRKRTVIEEAQISDEVRRQRLEIEADPGLLDIVEQEVGALREDVGSQSAALDDWGVDADAGERPLAT